MILEEIQRKLVEAINRRDTKAIELWAGIFDKRWRSVQDAKN